MKYWNKFRQFIKDYRAGGVVIILIGRRFYVYRSDDPRLAYSQARKGIAAIHDEYNLRHN